MKRGKPLKHRHAQRKLVKGYRGSTTHAPPKQKPATLKDVWPEKQKKCPD